MRYCGFRPLLLLLAVAAASCAAASSPAPGAAPTGPLGSPFVASEKRVYPLVIDLEDLALGTTVQFGRMPTESELHDLRFLPSMRRVVVALDDWPAPGASLDGLGRLPAEVEVVMLLPGYPPSRAAAEAWNFVQARLRIILLVDGPPADRALISDLNLMRNLDRVIAEMEEPSRAGFERLQRPLSFVKRVR